MTDASFFSYDAASPQVVTVTVPQLTAYTLPPLGGETVQPLLNFPGYILNEVPFLLWSRSQIDDKMPVLARAAIFVRTRDTTTSESRVEQHS